ncbi:MAG: class I SAM-dependent methyltransferase, partial [Desulfobulbaceae bacterium]|nr:class I SAM-dependent methyltransferase [Desulfobulbaceae bacterium]
MAEVKAYDKAAGSGKYEKAMGLSGKYDNVRRFWEDQLTGIFLRPALNDLVNYKRKRLERLRILDLGCGSGDGFDLIMGVTSKDPGLYDYIHQAIMPEMLQEYLGVDVNDNLLEQAQEYYGDQPKMRFAKHDLSQGIPVGSNDEPFDVYLTSYGTMSHFHDEQAAQMIADICKHAPERAVFIGDWLGRYSYEWQDLWHVSPDEEYFMDYRISYIYPPEERNREGIPAFPLRLITQNEVMRIIAKAEEISGVKIRPRCFFDRSIMVGRHLETRDYNANAPDLRLPINSLFEGYARTDLEQLMVDYVPREGFGHINNFFESFFMNTNTLVEHTIAMLKSQADGGIVTPKIPTFYPDCLRDAIMTMQLVIETAGKLPFGDPRANM